MIQGVAVYVTYASDVLLICWFGTQLTKHVRKSMFFFCFVFDGGGGSGTGSVVLVVVGSGGGGGVLLSQLEHHIHM
jgi:hypothetical protein